MVASYDPTTVVVVPSRVVASDDPTTVVGRHGDDSDRRGIGHHGVNVM